MSMCSTHSASFVAKNYFRYTKISTIEKIASVKIDVVKKVRK